MRKFDSFDDTPAKSLNIKSFFFVAKNSSSNLSMICNHWLLLLASKLLYFRHQFWRKTFLCFNAVVTSIGLIHSVALFFCSFSVFISFVSIVPVHIDHDDRSPFAGWHRIRIAIYVRDLYMQLSGILIEFKCAELLKTISQNKISIYESENYEQQNISIKHSIYAMMF